MKRDLRREPRLARRHFDPALRSDVVENRALHTVFSDPRSSVSCAAVTFRARFTASRVSRRRQSRLSKDAGPDAAGEIVSLDHDESHTPFLSS